MSTPTAAHGALPEAGERIDSTAFRRGVRAFKNGHSNPYNGPELRDEWEAGRAYAAQARGAALSPASPAPMPNIEHCLACSALIGASPAPAVPTASAACWTLDEIQQAMVNDGDYDGRMFEALLQHLPQRVTPAPAVPSGWKLVPIEPTKEMWSAADKADNVAYCDGAQHGAGLTALWDVMLDAAPAPLQRAAPAEPATEQLTEMAYLLGVVPRGEVVSIQWMECLKRQYLAALKVAATPAQQTQSDAVAGAVLVDWPIDGSDIQEELDAIYAEYATTFGKLPDADMARTMERVRLRLFDWWATHREAVREAIATPPQQAMPTMQDALAAGDGTLHGAIDHWQERALKAEAAASIKPDVQGEAS